MSGVCVAPGPKSLEALAWLTRVGAAPFEVLQLVIGCSRVRAHDHVHRLVEAGFARRVPMARGDGSLIVVTPTGAAMAGYAAGRAPRSLGPTTWAHASACAWVSAWLEVRGRTWWGERELLDDQDEWRYELTYEDHRGTARVTHRPDLAVQIATGPVAIEVELQRKTPRRQRGICAMYTQLTDDDGPLAGVIYITDRTDVAELVARVADDVGLCNPTISFRTMRDVKAQTHAAANARRLKHETAGRA